MTNFPLVSIITPCYNGETFLDQYFESILSQTYTNLELIFVNDGSTDRTEEIALSYREKLETRNIIYKYIYKPNGGQASAMNAGFKEMTGEYLVWPDSDDLLTPDSIKKRVIFLENNPSYGIVRSNAIALSHDTKETQFRFSDDENRFNDDIFLDLILEKTYCACGCYMIRTSKLREIYPDLKILESDVGQNWQILIPMAGKNRCGYLDENLYQVVLWPHSHSRGKRTLEQEVERQMGLKEVLLDGIRRSGRTDRDYDEIVHYKYQNLLLFVYTEYDAYKIAKKLYKELRKAKKLEPFAHTLYMKQYQPMIWNMIQLKNLLFRLKNKIARMIQTRKQK